LRLVVDAGRRRHDAHFEDAMIAAVAQTNGLIVATRNVKDLRGLG
jgi:predicted nucleic acid-binding protein